MDQLTQQQYVRDSVEFVGIEITADHDVSADTATVAILDRFVTSPVRAAVTWVSPDLRTVVATTNPVTGEPEWVMTLRVLRGPLVDGGRIDPDPGQWRVWALLDDTLEHIEIGADDWFEIL